MRYRPAGDEALIEPAGLMWSVVTESPKIASGRASLMMFVFLVSAAMSWKNGGSWM
jgi:hypothetical protein